MKALNRNLEEWFVQVGLSMVQLPRFQRFEAWGHREVESLLETVLDGLPAGATLILQVPESPQFKHRPLVSAPDRETVPGELLLDGQQRLTALWRSLNDTYEDRTFFVALNGENASGGWDVVSQHRYHRNGTRYPLWADEPTEVLRRGYVPLRLLRPGAETERDLKDWIKEATEGDLERHLEIFEAATKLRVSVATYNLPYLYLDASTNRSTVLDVFVKMNTRLVKLTAFDIIVAEIEGDTGESLHDLVASLQGQVPELARYADPQDVVLDVAALLQNRVPNRTGYFGVVWSDIVKRWEVLVEGCSRTVEFLEQERVPDGARFPTQPVLAPLISLWAHAPHKPDEMGNARTLLRRYMWRSFFTDRYEQAAATSVLQDHRALLSAVRNGATTANAPVLEAPLPEAAELLEVGWPKRRDRLARAVLLLSFRGGALDLADGAELTPSNIDRREYHHLFPRAYLRNRGVPEAEANNALNCSLITWRTNRTISADEPVKYLVERADAAALGEAELRHRLRSHAIPYESFVENDWQGFLLARADSLTEAVRALCEGTDWTPLREECF